MKRDLTIFMEILIKAVLMALQLQYVRAQGKTDAPALNKSAHILT
jgi:hypothetical protein